jgi:hypothetical protein
MASLINNHFYFSKLELNKSYAYLLFILSPGTFMRFGFDFGRFDALLVTALLLSLIFIRNPALYFLFSLIGILADEIYVFAFLPASFILFMHTSLNLTTFNHFLVKSISTITFYVLVVAILH